MGFCHCTGLHAKRLAQRIKQLGGRPPGSLELKRTQKLLQPPEDPIDLRGVVTGVIDAEKNAIATYTKIIKACGGTDFVTQDLAIELQADEEKHLCLFAGFLKGFGKK